VLAKQPSSSIALCDKVVLLVGGEVAFAGTPAEALEHFQVASFERMAERASRDSVPSEWARTFRETAAHRRIVADFPLTTEEHGLTGTNKPARVRRALRQVSVLTRRSARLHLRTPLRCLAFLGPPVGLILLFSILARSLGGESPASPTAIREVLLLLSVASFGVGLLTGVQEVLREAHVFQQERRVRVGVAPYILSKVALFAPWLVLSSSLLFSFFWVREWMPLPSGATYARFVVVFVLAHLAGLALGSLGTVLARERGKGA
jgi:hypothetical protein